MKLKYDYWDAFTDVTATPIGAIAMTILMVVVLGSFVLAVVLMVMSLGFVVTVLILSAISVIVLVGMTAYRIKKKGHYYAKY